MLEDIKKELLKDPEKIKDIFQLCLMKQKLL